MSLPNENDKQTSLAVEAAGTPSASATGTVGVADADIVFVASCNVDLSSYVERMPKTGETLMGKRFQIGFGGKGANTAMAASRLGSKCSVIAKLGNDVFGKDYLENFKRNGINTDQILFTDEAATGVAPIFVDDSGANAIVVILGANLLLTSEEVESCEHLIKRARVLVTNLEMPVEAVKTSLRLARKHNVTTVLNFAPAMDSVDTSLFEHVDFLILNKIEMMQLCGELVDEPSVDAMSIESVKEESKLLMDKFSKIRTGVIVTLGEQGVVYADKTSRTVTLTEVPKCDVIDTTGAGDAFVGSFAHYLNRTGSTQIALDLAAQYATLTCTALGTQSSYPPIAQLDAKFHV